MNKVEKIVNTGSNTRPNPKPAGFFFQPKLHIQRNCKECGEQNSNLHRKDANNEASIADSSTEKYISSLDGKGKSLTQEEKKFFEPRFGHDFSNVQLHTNGEANQSAESVNALAYAHGNHIVFGDNQYQPGTESGKHLMAHELSHVVQQKSGNLHRNVIRRITVAPVGSLEQDSCGKFERKFTFILDNPAPTDGYFIQQVDRYDNIVDCPSIGQCPANPTTTFWEAFFVTAGSTTFYRQGIGFTDSAGHDSVPNKSGARYAYGEIRFFPIAVTGDLGRNRVAGLWKPGNKGGAAPSGNLPSVSTAPGWWGNYTEGPATRYVTADWRCCNDGNDYNVIKSSV